MPVTLPARSLASSTTRSATSCGWVKRRVDVSATACLATWSGWLSVARATVAATPRSSSYRSVSTGPGLTVLTRTPCGPNSLDSDLQKLVSAPLAAL